MSDEWTEWKGGPRPVAPYTHVEVQFRGGLKADASAKFFLWRHCGGPSDIVRYRFVNAPTAEGCKGMDDMAAIDLLAANSDVPRKFKGMAHLYGSIQDDTAVSPLQGDKPTAQRELLAFLNDLCHPEQYGHAVSREVRKRARELANKLEDELRQP